MSKSEAFNGVEKPTPRNALLHIPGRGWELTKVPLLPISLPSLPLCAAGEDLRWMTWVRTWVKGMQLPSSLWPMNDGGGCCKNETKPCSTFANIWFTQISAVDYCYEISTQTIGLKTRLNKGYHWQHCFVVDIIRWMVLWVTQAYDQFVERGVEFPKCFRPPCFPNEWLHFLNSIGYLLYQNMQLVLGNTDRDTKAEHYKIERL